VLDRLWVYFQFIFSVNRELYISVLINYLKYFIYFNKFCVLECFLLFLHVKNNYFRGVYLKCHKGFQNNNIL
jgi:hypothetical protein